MTVRLLTLRASRAFLQQYLLVLISVRGSLNLRVMVRLEELCKFKKKISDLIRTHPQP
jgi:hypothetical protein